MCWKWPWVTQYDLIGGLFILHCNIVALKCSGQLFYWLSGLMNTRVTIFLVILPRQFDIHLQSYSLVHYYKGIIFQWTYFLSTNCKDAYSAALNLVKGMESHESNPVRSVMWRGLSFSHTNFYLAFNNHHNNIHNLASWLCNCEITLCEKYPWMTLSGVNPWHLDNHESWETCTVRWLMNTAAVSSLISASGVFEMISQRIFHRCLGQSMLRKMGNSLGMIGICYWTIHFT